MTCAVSSPVWSATAAVTSLNILVQEITRDCETVKENYEVFAAQQASWAVFFGGEAGAGPDSGGRGGP